MLPGGSASSAEQAMPPGLTLDWGG